ncbi:MAG: hypothetical protein A3A43_00405 [Candidatus Liptonbacteria bacterium RIFCSPLOWO2_01_FULL_56_20]|uniref:Uncharacterized protein n=1 Tax=Candidatus Liptonbacteria bacterium RIFCSPLOWO2_01_FULL_56_20 TaxID=1798652 RepID=A0A1G2CI69_9BACT|nr:MAG: hypothetical protein UY96_C0012G0015 [Parcubacteria group bacterium GW2011_GWB1_56_8]OGY98129.1 MAG: hypothetical protein A2681_02790 [Candidatus Liptonbacteria bacterium RIFCSPHIGHO2_01_FULL_56_18b]OGZ01089.1 MAG: hypothetical protein A3A43_00405 [Candidatus Liptonbacteria bacterium RIFCSPLOWO2_01_FULL_56_20]
MNEEAIRSYLVPAAAGIFLAVVIAFILMSVILDYHWRRYGTHPKTLVAVRVVYYGVSVVLLAVMAVLIYVLSR